MRWLRRLLVLLVILAALAAGGNVWLASAVEKRAAQQIQKVLDLSAPPEVDIDGFPILLRIFQGEIPGVTIDGRDVDVQGLLVDRYHVEVEGIRASLSDLRGGVRNVRVGGGEASAQVSQDAVNAYLERQKERSTVTFGDGTTRVRTRGTYGGRTYTVVATGTLEVNGEFLMFTAENVTIDGRPPGAILKPRVQRDASFKVRLPELPGGIRPRRIVVRSGSARLEAEFGPTSLEFGG